MPYARMNKFAVSQRPMALNVSGWEPTTGVLHAIWAGRKRGVTTVSMGTLKLWAPNRELFEVHDALAHSDTRYGPSWELQWDGEFLQLGPNIGCPPDEYRKHADHLEVIRANLPVVPDHYDGWYYRWPEVVR